MSFRFVKIDVVLLAAALICAGSSGSLLSAQQLPPPKPKSGPTTPSSGPPPTLPKESTSPTEKAPRAAASDPATGLAIGELTPVPPTTLPPERVDGERATAADIGRFVEWLAYLGAALYRAGSPETTIRDLYQQLDAARDETGRFLTRAREGDGPSAQDYARLRSTLARLHERIRAL
jgi:hypothetical protein